MLKTVRVPEMLVPLFEQAQQYVSRYFAGLDFTPEHGTLEISGQRYVLVRAASMAVEFYEMVRNFYSQEEEAQAVTHALLFDIAHAMGLGDAKTFAERMQVSDPIARLSAGPVHFAHAGWAFVDISEESSPTPDDDYYLLYDHPYSFESDSWLNAQRSSDCPVCVMNAGYSSGWCESSFGVRLIAVEILCRAKGDAACRFIMAPPARIERHIARYAERHPDLAPSIKNYLIPGFFAKRTDAQLLRENLELERRVQARTRELASINLMLERDISERRRAEAALRASQELNERLLEALPGGVLHVDPDGVCLRFNGEALRILGRSAQDVGRFRMRDLRGSTLFEDGTCAQPDDYALTRALTSGLPQPPQVLGIRHASGQIVWAVFRAVPLRDPETSRISGAVCTFLDISERKGFEEKLLNSQKLESLGILAGGIAHDFNNLLVSVLGNASLGKALDNMDPRALPLFDDIEEGARRAAELTRQMLDYAGQGKFKLRRVELPELARETVRLMKAVIPPQIELYCHFPEGVPAIQADPTQLRQVLTNLVTNAADSLEGRSGRVVLSLGSRRLSEQDLEPYLGKATAGSFVELMVEDNGGGMSEETRRRIFDPFFTTKFAGRGLGMAAVLGVVQSHHGAVRVLSQEGVGTRVCVLLPCQANAEPSAVSAHASVLVVDDDDGVRALAQRVLSARGYRVTQAVDGAQALQILSEREAEIDVVLLDVTMPNMSGFEVLKQLRARGNRVNVLMSSGYDVGKEDFDFAEVSGFLEKPYDASRLLAEIERVTRSAR